MILNRMYHLILFSYFIFFTPQFHAGDFSCAIKSTQECSGLNKVVSAQDLGLGIPGGTNELSIDVSGGDATLSIERTGGTTGSAVFLFNGVEEQEIVLPPGLHTITLQGREVSDFPRNMKIKASVGDEESEWMFTVFRVDIQGYLVGNINTTAQATGFDKAKSIIGNQSLQSKFVGSVLGHRSGSFLTAAAIIIEGKVFPSGVSKNDFNLCHNRFSGFNISRRRSSRAYYNSCLSGDVNNFSNDNTDDGIDSDEDLVVDEDFTGDLYIWAIDEPFFPSTRVPNPGDIYRLRINFTEQIKYAGVSVSKEYKWNWGASIENINGTVIENADYGFDDNFLGIGHSELTEHRSISTLSQPIIISTAPNMMSINNGTQTGNISGEELDQSSNCTVAFMYIENEMITETHITRIPMALEEVNFSLIEGEYKVLEAINFPPNIPPQTGEYDIQLYILDQQAISLDAIMITN